MHSQSAGGFNGQGGPLSRLEALEYELSQLKNMRMMSMTSSNTPLDMGMGASMGRAGQLQPLQPMQLHIHSGANPSASQAWGAPGPMPPMPATAGTSGSGWAVIDSVHHKEIMTAHKDMLQQMVEMQGNHNQLLNQHRSLEKAHADLMKAHTAMIKQLKTGSASAAKKKHPALGVVRLDYNYPPAAGDTDSPASFGYDVYYRCTPGLTFERAQAGNFPEDVERRFAEAIKFLEARGCVAITGDCGFMMAFQVLARKIATGPVFMSSMVQCPVIGTAFDASEKILILTANSESLASQKETLLEHCGFAVDSDRFIIAGCQHVPGFEAVALGKAVPTDIVQPGIVKMVKAILQEQPAIKAILMECTELPAYSDAVRFHTGLPVWDCITCCDFYASAFKEAKRFHSGEESWQEDWDGEQEEYTFGKNLTKDDMSRIKSKILEKQDKMAKHKKKKGKLNVAAKSERSLSPTLGVLRLDYNYPPAAGDIDCPGSYSYKVLFRCVPGFTFEMAQSGKLSPEVEPKFVEALKWLEKKGVCGITGDCGFMMAFQPLARQHVSVPVFMSAMVQCPLISVAFDKYDKVLILTANSATLKPQKECLLSHCGFDVDDDRFVIRGCQDVHGFDAVAKGEKVDVKLVTPGIVKMVKELLQQVPTIRAICMECTELPPYSDALRKETGLPVFDAITCTDYFVSARQDNPRFGLNEWQLSWDGHQDEYELGGNLTMEERRKLITG